MKNALNHPARTAFVIDVDDASFDAEVIARSGTVPVLVDFWAPWCAPCRALGPVLDRLAEDFDGRFVLAKLNTESAPGLAQRFAIRSIPAVKLFIGGQVVDEFAGALPEGAIRAFLDKHLPSPAEPLRVAAAAARADQDLVTAIGLLRDALVVDPSHQAARLDLIDTLIQARALDEAATLLAEVDARPGAEARVQRLRASLDLARRSDTLGDPDALHARLLANPDDHAARLELAQLAATRGQWEDALSTLLELVRRDRSYGDDAGRRSMIDLFLLVPDDALVRRYRSELAAVLNR